MATPFPDPVPNPVPNPSPGLVTDPVPGATGRVGVHDEPGRVVVHLAGEVDDELRPHLDDAVDDLTARLRERTRPVAVDAGDVTFMDSAGAAFLARLAVTVRPARLTVHPSRPVAFLLDVTRLSDVVDVVDAPAPDAADRS
ncbi:STAS domain-containing protein [Kineococcus sp. SYSU DK001]|uniref:STAS domain-containing protein n=1 Tax=Kineococcus sp. SYSU DK001 TaxID=3383122 RepID=UPI003D7D5B03